MNLLPSIVVFLVCLITTTITMTSQLPLTESYTIVIGLNPAFQKRFILPTATPCLVSGNVHRASEIQQGVGGKGQDVFTSLSCLSTTDATTKIETSPSDSKTSTTNVKRGPIKLAQFLGSGAAGDTVASLLSSLQEDRHLSSTSTIMDGVSLTVRTQAPLRTCTTIVGTDAATELVEPSGTISHREVRQLCEAVDRCFDEDGGTHAGVHGDNTSIVGGYDTGDSSSRPNAAAAAAVGSVCIMGSMPPGCPPDLYATLYEKIASRRHLGTSSSGDLICLVDSVVGIGHLLDAMAQQNHCDGRITQEFGSTTGPPTNKRNNMLKINLAELRKLAGIHPKHNDDVDNPSIDEIGNVINGLYETYPSVRDALSYVAITNGKHPSYLVAVGGSGGRADDGNDEKIDIIYEIKIPVLGRLDTCGTFRDTMDQAGREEEVTTLYPIGAGDTVAAGTLASWQYLMQRQNQCSGVCEWLDKRVQHALIARKTVDFVVVAFAFGLACGSASCLQQENSVFTIDNVIQLFDDMDMPQPHLIKKIES